MGFSPCLIHVIKRVRGNLQIAINGRARTVFVITSFPARCDFDLRILNISSPYFAWKLEEIEFRSYDAKFTEAKVDY